MTVALSPSLYDLNQAIIRAFGLDPDDLRSFHLELDKDVGPIVTVELFLRDDAGQPFLEDGELATISKRYVLVERDAPPLQPKGSTGEIHMEGAD